MLHRPHSDPWFKVWRFELKSPPDTHQLVWPQALWAPPLNWGVTIIAGRIWGDLVRWGVRAPCSLQGSPAPGSPAFAASRRSSDSGFAVRPVCRPCGTETRGGTWGGKLAQIFLRPQGSGTLAWNKAFPSGCRHHTPGQPLQARSPRRAQWLQRAFGTWGSTAAQVVREAMGGGGVGENAWLCVLEPTCQWAVPSLCLSLQTGLFPSLLDALTYSFSQRKGPLAWSAVVNIHFT